MRRFLLPLALLACMLMSCTSREASVTSPDKNLSLTLEADSGQATITVRYKGKVLVDKAPVGIDFADGSFGRDVSISHGCMRSVVDDYDLPTGKTSHVHSRSSEMRTTMADKEGRHVEVYLRAFDDGVAYRYVIPEQKGMEELSVKGELMDLHIVGDPVLKGMVLPGFNTSHEAPYTTQTLSAFGEGSLIDMPALLMFQDGPYMAITEAMVVDYAGMMLTIRDGRLSGVLSPRHDDSGLCVTGPLPRRSPWRVFQISDRAGALLESTILTTLADPCRESDLSWLNPGTATWPWWNGYQVPSELRKGDIGTVNQNISRYYIDFCAQNDIKYHSITGVVDENDWEYCWYYNEGSGPGSPLENDDTSRPYPGYDIQSVCRYAQERGVDIRVWAHWKTLDKNMEETFRLYRQWGIKGLMVDFMDRDDEEMIAFQKKTLEMAMKYHLHIQFHGASKPSGLQRTYPCEFTREGTFNYETYKWDSRYNGEIRGADHDLDIPFTRCLAGPTDYHLGSFRAVKTEDFKPVYLSPVTTSTRSHSLAMYVVLESTLHLISDAPDAYRGEEGFEFLHDIPTVWDETRVPQAEPDKYIIVARRSGKDWYVGCIGNAEARSITLPLDFLGEGKYDMTLYCDADDSDENLNHLEISRLAVERSRTIDVQLSPSGGFAARITPAP